MKSFQSTSDIVAEKRVGRSLKPLPYPQPKPHPWPFPHPQPSPYPEPHPEPESLPRTLPRHGHSGLFLSRLVAVEMAHVNGKMNRLRLSKGSRHPPASTRRSRRNRQRADRHNPPTLPLRPSHDLTSPPTEITIAVIVGPASRRPIRALVDPRRAARQSNAALVCDAIWSRVFPSNTCVIGIWPRSVSPESGATTLRTRDYPIRTLPKSAVNNGAPNHFTTPIINRGRPGHAEIRPPSGCRARYCAGTNPRRRVTLRTMALPGSPGTRDEVCSTGTEAGRRRSSSVVAALQSTTHATTLLGRRWVAGTPTRHSDPEGRG